MAKIIVQFDVCLEKCSQCLDECPMRLLNFEKKSDIGLFVIEEEECIECKNCEVTCPVKAIKIESVP